MGDINDWKWNVNLWDILHLENHKWALVVDRSTYTCAGTCNNTCTCTECLKTAQITDEYELQITMLRTGDSRVRINNNRIHIRDNKSGQQHHEVKKNNMLHIMAHFLGNRSKKLLIDALKNEFKLPDVTEMEAERMVERLIDSTLVLLFGSLGRGFEKKMTKSVQKVSDWFDKNHIRESKVNENRNELTGELFIGDRLEFSRRCYSHWGIFLGQLGQALLVLHFSTAGSGKIFAMKKAYGSGYFAKDKPVYRIDAIAKPLENYHVRINNRKDNTWKPLEFNEIQGGIVGRLVSQTHREPREYSVMNHNCKHLVDEIRYRLYHSDQPSPPFIGELPGC